MNYQAHYDRLIERAKNRVLEGYVENHHVIPKCIGGTNDKSNIVSLTPEEHYVAHQLLVKLYPDVKGLAYAAVAMCGEGRTKNRNNRAYGWVRRAQGAARKGSPSPWKGKTFSPEQLKKISIGRTGKGFHDQAWHDAHHQRMLGNTYNNGRIWDRAVVEKRAQSNRIVQTGRTLDKDHILKLREAAARPETTM